MRKEDALPPGIKEYITRDGKPLLNGYLRFFTDEVVSKNILSVLSPLSFWKGGIPFASTAFGDVMVWDREGYIVIYKLIDSDFRIMLHGDRFFFDNLEDQEFQKDFLDLDLFTRARERYGPIDNTQCYIFEPIPALGGDKNVNHIAIGNMVEYIALICSLIE